MTNELAASLAERSSKIRSWMLAIRPLTLTLSLAPVAVGATLAWAETGRTRPAVVAGAGVAAALIQIGTNLYNDAADHRRGGDGPQRLGPPRVTAQGLLSGAAVARAAFVAFGVAAVIGVGLVCVGGWPILALGLLSIVCGLGYSGGPYPIAYSPFGESFVILFFGVAAVCGTFWLAASVLAPAPVVAGLALGLFAAAALLANNHRDREEDARVGRRTLAIVIGPRWTRVTYGAFVLTPFALLAPLAGLEPTSHAPLALAAAPIAAGLALRFASEPPGRGFNQILAWTAQTQALFAALLCWGATW